MSATAGPTPRRAIHPFHAAMLAGAAPLFLGALLGDYAYWTSHQVEWSNFASWLLVGGMVLASAALLCALSEALGGHYFNRVPVMPDMIVNAAARREQSHKPLQVSTA